MPQFWSYDVYHHYNRCLLSLQHIGLDNKGGAKRLAQIKEECNATKELFPTAAIKVVDAAKASKYVNLGLHLTSDVSFAAPPGTLAQAADNYQKVARLVNAEGGERETTSIDALNQKIASTENEILIWEYEREKFRLQTEQTYKRALIDMALREKARHTSGIYEMALH